MNSESLDARTQQRAQETLRRYSLLAYALDQVFRVPGTSWRFGLDAVIGLIPGAGDVLTSFIGLYGLLIARRLGAPASIQLRMSLNLAVDTAVGAIPVLGDLFDFAFKSHVRNRVLLENWLARPHKTHRTSFLLLAALVLAFIVLMAGVVWLALASVQALVRLLS